LRHDGLLHEIVEGRMRGKPTRGRRRIQLLHDLAIDGGFVTLQWAAEDREGWRHIVAYLGGGLVRGPPFGRTAVIFVTILRLFLAQFKDKIAATSDQMRLFGPENALKCVCLGELTALPQRCQPVYC